MSDVSDEFLRAATHLDAPTPPAPGPTDIDGELVWDALSKVIDPEIGLDIVSVGLVYELEQVDSSVRVTFTLTTPGCPMEKAITDGIVHAVSAVPGVEHVLPNLVWEPHWHPGMIREGAW